MQTKETYNLMKEKNTLNTNRSSLPSLVFCLLIDAIGYVSYLLPTWGEWADTLWAPLSAFIFYRTFSGQLAKVGSLINLVEEALPFADFIPSFTLAYYYMRYRMKNEA